MLGEATALLCKSMPGAGIQPTRRGVHFLFHIVMTAVAEQLCDG